MAEWEENSLWSWGLNGTDKVCGFLYWHSSITNDSGAKRWPCFLDGGWQTTKIRAGIMVSVFLVTWEKMESLIQLVLFFMVVFKVICFLYKTTFKNKMTEHPAETLCWCNLTIFFGARSPFLSKGPYYALSSYFYQDSLLLSVGPWKSRICTLFKVQACTKEKSSLYSSVRMKIKVVASQRSDWEEVRFRQFKKWPDL